MKVGGVFDLLRYLGRHERNFAGRLSTNELVYQRTCLSGVRLGAVKHDVQVGIARHQSQPLVFAVKLQKQILKLEVSVLNLQFLELRKQVFHTAHKRPCELAP